MYIFVLMIRFCGRAPGVSVIVIENEYDDPSSNHGRGYSHFTFVNTFGEGMNPNILSPVMR